MLCQHSGLDYNDDEIREVLNHQLDLGVDMRPLAFPSIFMSKPSDRPKVPPIGVYSLQVARPIMLHDPLVPVLEHGDMPSTGNLHQDSCAPS